MKRDLYFKELAVVLGRAGFTPLPQEDDSLPVEYHSQRLCRINEQGNVFYRQEEVDSPEREKACAKATDIAGTVLEYGSSTGTDGWIPGADVPFIGADGFCSPVGSGWVSRVTSEFGYRSDPFTGQTKGHTGIDIAVPTGTPVRAALPGVVTTAAYNAGGYGYYVMIDHGNGMVTLYAHNSKLLVRAGDTVETGDIVSLSGSTGRSTGPHLHFEVRVDGQRVNPRSYLPTD